MADYYSILKKTIDGLPRNTPELRNAVYQKARTAIGNQLRGMNPPPGEEAVNAQLQLLEDAILVVDMEYSGAPAEAQTAQQTTPLPEPAPAPAPPPPQPEHPSSVEPAPIPVAPTEPISPSAAQAGQVSVAPSPVVPSPSTAPAVGASSEPPTVGMVPPPQPSVPGAAAAPVPEGVAPQAPAAQAPAAVLPPLGEDEDPFAPKKKSGFLKKLSVPLIILVLLGGSGYAIWLNRDALQPIVAAILPSDNPGQSSSSDESGGAVSSSEQVIDDDTAAQTQKESVKLGADGSETEILPSDTENGSQAGGQSTENQLDGGNQSVEAVDGDGNTDSGASQEEAALPIGEVAYLYEEGSAGSGATRTNAAVAWETKQEVLADGFAPEPVIVGRMEVPEKDLIVDIEIKRNVDEALSASHIIEVRFDVPEGFSGSNIDNIARFVMKSSEEARGEPLVAVPVKVSDGFFLIALDNLQQAVDVNTRLMLDSSWIDIPISYATGKRALITLEKGGTGERIFQDTIKDWQNR